VAGQANPKLEHFLARPLAVASALAKGECGGTYAEACIVVSAAISSVASLVWPGKGIDQKRFIEAWVTFGDANNTLVSRPLLVQTLLNEGQIQEAQALAHQWPALVNLASPVPRALMGRYIDATESMIRSECSSVALKKARDHSYPAIFYDQVRNALTHEYELGRSASRIGQWTGDPGVSYTEGVHYTRNGEQKRTILIRYDPDWLIDQARTMGRNADAALAAGPIRCPTPGAWWIEG
jgi:hypothetical protein